MFARTVLVIAACLSLITGHTASAQSPDISAALQITRDYEVVHDIIYARAENYDLKLDLYLHSGNQPRPTLIYFHGGGWLPGYTKEMMQLQFLPFMQLNWNIVNVEYRNSDISLAPAAVEDCLCALKWVYRNAEKFHFDSSQLVVSGRSAGGHLSLTTGYMSTMPEFKRPCSLEDAANPASEMPPVAAVVNWFGITDVADVAQGNNQQSYAVLWFRNLVNWMDIAKRASPLTYVKAGLPPTITIHGTNDKAVPHSHATRLHDALAKAGVKNKLITIEGGGHGGFTLTEHVNAYNEVFTFLKDAGLTVTPQ